MIGVGKVPAWIAVAAVTLPLAIPLRALGGEERSQQSRVVWHEPIDVSRPGQDATAPVATYGTELGGWIDSAGTAFWTRSNGSNWVAQARTIDGRDAVVDLSPGWYDVRDLHAAGNTAVWLASSGPDRAVQAAVLSRDMETDELAVDLTTVSAFGKRLRAPRVAARTYLLDEPAVVWCEHDGSNWILRFSGRSREHYNRLIDWAVDEDSWSQPINVSQRGRDASEPELAVGWDGTTVAVWVESDGTDRLVRARVFLSRRVLRSGPDAEPIGWSPGWGPIVDLSAAEHDASAPHVAVAEHGHVAVVWVSSDGKHRTIQARRLSVTDDGRSKTRGDTWGPVINLSEPGEDATTPQVAINREGAAVAVWSRFSGTYWVAETRSLDPGSPVFKLSTHIGHARTPHIANRSHTAVVAWAQHDGANWVIKTRTASTAPAVSWGPITTVSTPGRDARAPRVLDSGSDGTVVWLQNNGRNDVVQASRYEVQPLPSPPSSDRWKYFNWGAWLVLGYLFLGGPVLILLGLLWKAWEATPFGRRANRDTHASEDLANGKSED